MDRGESEEVYCFVLFLLVWFFVLLFVFLFWFDFFKNFYLGASAGRRGGYVRTGGVQNWSV